MVSLYPVYTAMDFSLVRKVFDMSRPSLDTLMTNLEKLWGKHSWRLQEIYVKALNALKDGGVKN